MKWKNVIKWLVTKMSTFYPTMTRKGGDCQNLLSVNEECVMSEQNENWPCWYESPRILNSSKDAPFVKNWILERRFEIDYLILKDKIFHSLEVMYPLVVSEKKFK